MKNLFSLILLLAVLGLLSCQNNSPVEASDYVSKKTNTQFEIFDRIEICCEVCDPHSGVCKVLGLVEYTHDIIQSPESPDEL